MFNVTLKSLRDAGACTEGYNKVVRALQGKPFTADDANRETYIRFAHKQPIPIVDILKSNNLDDALWALRCVQGHDRDLRLYAVWCARQVEHLMTDQRSKDALGVAERHANGLATDEELDAARAAAWAAWAARAAAWAAARDAAWAARAAARYAARDAAWAAARAAAWAARDAAWAAWAAARYAVRDAVREAQSEMLVKMCNGEAPWQVQP